MRTRGDTIVKGGALAGVAGGVAISIAMTAAALSAGQDVWVGAKAAAYPVMGERALAPGFDLVPVLLGVAIHFAVSVGWGLLFALLAYGLPRGATLAAGIGFGIVVWIAMYYMVLPLIGAGKLAGATPVPMAVLQHIVFGAAVATAFLPFQRPVEEGAVGARPRSPRRAAGTAGTRSRRRRRRRGAGAAPSGRGSRPRALPRR